MNLYLLRHAVTSYSENDLNDSLIDSPLSELGQRQAKALIPILSHHSYDAIIVSPLRRTRETIQPYLDTLKNPKVVVSDLTLERDLGELTNSTNEEFQRYIENHHIHDRVTWTPPHGESIAAVYERAEEFLAFLKEAYRDKTVLVCGHQNFLRCLELLIEGKPVADFYNPEPPRLDHAELKAYTID